MLCSQLPSNTIVITNIQDRVPVFSSLGIPICQAYEFPTLYGIWNEELGNYDYYGATTIKVYNSAALTNLVEYYTDYGTYCNCADCNDLSDLA